MNLIEASSLAISRRPFFFAGIAIVIILLLVSLQTFIKNGVQGRLKQAVDDIGDQFSFGNTKVIKIMTTGSIGQTTQDEPYYLESQYAVTRNEAQIQLLDNTRTTTRTRGQLVGLDKNIVPSLRMLIQKANYSIRVDDVHQTYAAIQAIVLQHDGILVDSTIQEQMDGQLFGTTVFKVNPEDYRSAVNALDALGKVETKQLSTEDVGEEFTDLNARMENAKVIRERLYQIVKAKTSNVKDILEVEREIARVSEEIERFQGRINYLQSQSALATITIHYYKKVAPQIPVWSMNFKQKMIAAGRLAAETFVGTFNAGVLILAVAIPVGFWIVLISLAVYHGLRLFFRKRAS